MIFIRINKIIILFKWRNEIKSSLVQFKGYTSPQIGPIWTKMGQNRGISDIFGREDAIKPLKMSDFNYKIKYYDIIQIKKLKRIKFGAI